MARHVLLDAGNSSLKWALVEDGRWRAQGRCEYGELQALRVELGAGMACFVASVARAGDVDRLRALLDEARCVATWLRSEARRGDLVNGYDDPGQLGVDRWMAMVGARRRTRGATLVVSAGTAMTVDAVADTGAFLGGLIVPGVALMRRALAQGTAGVDAGHGDWQPFPRRTSDAVHSGILAAACGAIRAQYERLAALAGHPPACLMTGGDAALLRAHLDIATEHVPGLVLEGIEQVASEEERQ